jgi:mono/diheme cytochrome c family protein
MRRAPELFLPLVLALFATGCDPTPDEATSKAAVIARGAYLANGITRCFWCHSPQDKADPSSPKPETLGAGDVLDPATPVVAANLTPDPETGIGLWTDHELARAIRRGRGRDGRRLRGDHPAAYYSIMSDEDVAALIAYLRSLRPIRNQLPRSAPQVTNGETVQAFVQPAKAAGLSTPESRGAYLVQLGECAGCHTTTTPAGKPHRAMTLGGGRRFVETRKRGTDTNYRPTRRSQWPRILRSGPANGSCPRRT